MEPERPVPLRAQRQIKPPPFSQHLREFAASPSAWAVLGRNLIPVVGIYGFGWSVPLSVFSYWFDGLVALVAIITAMVPRALRESQTPPPKTVPPPEQEATTSSGRLKIIFSGGLTWVVLVGIVGLPYWIVLIPLHDLLLGNELRRELTHSPVLWGIFGSLAVGHFWRAFQSGYDTMPDKELRQRARWNVYLLVLRAVAMFIMAAHGLYFILVPLMALLLAYFEIWPERALGAVFGDPKRLWEYDPEKGKR